MSTGELKELIWVASSLRDLREFPEDVRQVMGFALYLAQTGGKHNCAKPLHGCLEIARRLHEERRRQREGDSK